MLEVILYGAAGFTFWILGCEIAKTQKELESLKKEIETPKVRLVMTVVNSVCDKFDLPVMDVEHAQKLLNSFNSSTVISAAIYNANNNEVIYRADGNLVFRGI